MLVANDKKINLLWTSGWDSTFRLLQLSTLEVNIQPYYFIHNARGSRDTEINRMNNILNEIANKREFKAKILPIIFVQVEDVLKNMKNQNISDIYKKLKYKYALGEQYEWFGLYCDYNNIDMELGIVCPPNGKMERMFISENCGLNLKDGDWLNERKVITNKDSIVYPLAKHFILPITKYSKKDMENIARENEWLDIMKLTWFCHNPINNKPCGYCNPCRDAMALGMEWRMPFISKVRYYLMSPLMLLKPFIKKILGKQKF